MHLHEQEVAPLAQLVRGLFKTQAPEIAVGSNPIMGEWLTEKYDTHNWVGYNPSRKMTCTTQWLGYRNRRVNFNQILLF